MSRALLLCCVLGAAVALVAGQQPTLQSCVSAGQSLSSTSGLSQLLPCQNGPSDECCSIVNAQFVTGPLKGCGCVPGTQEALQQQLQSNSLASSAGVDISRVRTILQGCGVPFIGGTGKSACPPGGAPAAAAPAGGAPAAGAPAGGASAGAAPAGVAPSNSPPPPPPPSSPSPPPPSSGNQHGMLWQKFCAFHPLLCSLEQKKG